MDGNILLVATKSKILIPFSTSFDLKVNSPVAASNDDYVKTLEWLHSPYVVSSHVYVTAQSTGDEVNGTGRKVAKPSYAYSSTVSV